MSRRRLSRREVLASAGSLAVGTGLAVGLSGRARGAVARSEYKPDHVSIEYDEETLLKYRPRLWFSGDEYESFINLYGWLATSTEYESDVAVYWAEYTHQSGVSEYDSHDGDHEPIYVHFRDGAVQKVVYSGYHWLRATSYAPVLDGTHALFRVIEPWHHYTTDTVEGRLTSIGDLTGTFDRWLEEGLDESLAPGTVVNPWIMSRREHWWRSVVAGVSLDATYVSILHAVGAHKAGVTDL